MQNHLTLRCTQENVVNYTFSKIIFEFKTFHKKWVVIKYQIGYKQLNERLSFPTTVKIRMYNWSDNHQDISTKIFCKGCILESFTDTNRSIHAVCLLN